MIDKIKLFLICFLTISLAISITIIIVLGFSLKEKAKEFDYSLINKYNQEQKKIKDKINKRFDKLEKLNAKDFSIEIKNNLYPFFESNKKYNNPIIIYQLDYEKMSKLELLKYIEIEHQQIYLFTNYIVEK